METSSLYFGVLLTKQSHQHNYKSATNKNVTKKNQKSKCKNQNDILK